MWGGVGAALCGGLGPLAARRREPPPHGQPGGPLILERADARLYSRRGPAEPAEALKWVSAGVVAATPDIPTRWAPVHSSRGCVHATIQGVCTWWCMLA